MLLLGSAPRQRDRAVLSLLGSLVYLVWFTALLTFAIPQGRVNPVLGYTLAALMTPGMLLFYPLIRSGWTRRFTDPSLVSFQIIWGCLVAAFGYAVAPTGRGALLQTIGLGLVFGFMTLKPKEALHTGLAVLGMLLLLLASSLLLPLPDFDLKTQAVKLLTAAFIMGLISMQSYKFALLREQVYVERRQLESAQLSLELVTRYDALTGLLSRVYGQERLDEEHERTKLSGRTFGLALLDLDHFKQINDQHGHQVGDEVLVTFAQAAREVLRDTDLIARWGGEEFLIILPDTHEANMVLQALERLQQKLRRATVSKTVPSLRISFSAGYTLWKAPETADDLVHRADQALYEAKRVGRDRCVQAV